MEAKGLRDRLGGGSRPFGCPAARHFECCAIVSLEDLRNSLDSLEIGQKKPEWSQMNLVLRSN